MNIFLFYFQVISSMYLLQSYEWIKDFSDSTLIICDQVEHCRSLPSLRKNRKRDDFLPQALLVAASFAITQRRLCNFIIIFYFNLGLTFFRYSNHGFSRFSCPTFTLYPCAIQQSRRRSGRVIQEFEKHFHRTDFQSSF